MYPEVEQYFAIVRAAKLAHDIAAGDLGNDYHKAVRRTQFDYEETNSEGVWDQYRQQQQGGLLREAYQKHTAAERAIANTKAAEATRARELLEASEHPEVKWINDHSLSEYQDYSEAVLKALPTDDPNSLWEIKAKYGMCSEFDRLYAAADAEGVFNKGVKVPGHRELVALRNKVARNWGDRYVRDFMGMLTPYQKAVKEEHETAMAEAKAEWQKLDEAHAENVSRNRSEGAKRAAETRRRNREAAESASAEIAVAVATQDAKAIIEADVADRERARELMAHLARRS